MTTMERIVVGGDHTPAATGALRWALGEAARSGACVVVVHAFDVAGRADLALERDLDRARRDARYRTQSWVVETVGDLDTTVPVIVSTPDASVERALLSASQGAQMVVIGQPRRGGNQHLATALADACSCPVKTVGANDVAAVPS
jgi:nucleotide-binding universal stress UspA family protein